MTFGPLFCINCCHHLDLFIATHIMRTFIFYNSAPPILASKINQQIMFFRTPFLDITFLFVMLMLKKKTSGTPSKSGGRRNGTQIHQVAPTSPENHPETLDMKKGRSSWLYCSELWTAKLFATVGWTIADDEPARGGRGQQRGRTRQQEVVWNVSKTNYIKNQFIYIYILHVRKWRFAKKEKT